MKLFQLDFKMKEYEIYSDLKTPVGSNIIVRLDGRGFHKLAKDLNLEKPYDLNLLMFVKTFLKSFHHYSYTLFLMKLVLF